MKQKNIGKIYKNRVLKCYTEKHLPHINYDQKPLTDKSLKRLQLHLSEPYVHWPMEDVHGSIFHTLLCFLLWPVVASWTGSGNGTLPFLVSM